MSDQHFYIDRAGNLHNTADLIPDRSTLLAGCAALLAVVGIVAALIAWRNRGQP
jgi:hypothetical protein